MSKFFDLYMALECKQTRLQPYEMLEQLEKRNGVKYHRHLKDLFNDFVLAAMYLTMYQYGEQQDNRMLVDTIKAYFRPCYELENSNELDYEFVKLNDIVIGESNELVSKEQLQFAKATVNLWHDFKAKYEKKPQNSMMFAMLVEDLADLLVCDDCVF